MSALFEAMTARVLELNGLVEGARVQRTKSHPGAPVHVGKPR